MEAAMNETVDAKKYVSIIINTEDVEKFQDEHKNDEEYFAVSHLGHLHVYCEEHVLRESFRCGAEKVCNPRAVMSRLRRTTHWSCGTEPFLTKLFTEDEPLLIIVINEDMDCLDSLPEDFVIPEEDDLDVDCDIVKFSFNGVPCARLLSTELERFFSGAFEGDIPTLDERSPAAFKNAMSSGAEPYNLRSISIIASPKVKKSEVWKKYMGDGKWMQFLSYVYFSYDTWKKELMPLSPKDCDCELKTQEFLRGLEDTSDAGGGKIRKSKPRACVTPYTRSQAKKLNEVRGNLFCPATESCSLAHCVSTDLKMGAGIAVAFKRKFKSVDELIAQRKNVGEVAVLKRNGRYIYYLITKARYFHKPTYDSIRTSLRGMKRHALVHGVKEMAIPRLACGLDGCDWLTVSNLICDVFADTDICITVYIPE